jgi:UPF0271 protein
MMARIDLNCDLGEGAAWDAELMPLVSSANIACGGHAGDERTMRTTVALALRHGVAIGAHPGFPDREHFGRREIEATPGEICVWTREQVMALRRVAAAAGARLAHVKPHGALYNLAARDEAVAMAVAQAVRAVDPTLRLVGLAGSRLPTAGRALGLPVAHEVFADRAYHVDGSLAARTNPHAMITDMTAAAARAVRLLREGVVRSIEGSEVRLPADTLCLHGDGDGAVALAQALRRLLDAHGIAIRPLGAAAG